MISILMPVKNAGLYLTECLESILSQTYLEWELIAVNDHSSDNTMNILKAFQNKDSRINVLVNEGQGIISALKTAYKASKGHVISRMDADDKMSSNKLKHMQRALTDAGKQHVAVGLVEYFSDATVNDGYRRYAVWLNDITIAEKNFQDIYKECSIPSPNWMMFKDDLEKCKAFNSDIYPEDYDLAFRMKGAGMKIKCINEITHYWRDHADRASRNDPNYSDNRFTSLKVNYFIKQDLDSGLPLYLWGAGGRGKVLATQLIKNNIDFKWICNNPNKIGHDIYGKVLRSSTEIFEISKAQVIFAVSTKNESESIKTRLDQQPDIIPFYFC